MSALAGQAETLRKPKVCEHCKEVMPAGTTVRWVRETFTLHRSGSGRAYETRRSVPVHRHDCIAERIAKAYAEKGLPNPADRNA